MDRNSRVDGEQRTRMVSNLQFTNPNPADVDPFSDDDSLDILDMGSTTLELFDEAWSSSDGDIDDKEENSFEENKAEAREGSPDSVESLMTCPICKKEVIEATEFRCGHIFCGICILEAVLVEPKCPECQTKVEWSRDARRIRI